MISLVFFDEHLALTPLVLTIGNFDGVHLGHQAMLTRTQSIAKQLNLKSAVMVFEPQPKEFFNPDGAPARLTNLDEKVAKIKATATIDYIIVARFDAALANLDGDTFCQRLQNIGVRHLVIGSDFRFGKDRTGGLQSLQAYFGTTILDSVVVQGNRVSSTAIRQALAVNDLLQAKQLLGNDYAITGQVVAGDKIGRQLGFPTANIALQRLKPALLGIYGVVVTGDFSDNKGGIAWQDGLFGCANLGTRPSVNGKEHRLEVHLPKFDGNLYNKTLTITFIKFLHLERRYPNLDALKHGIQDDIDALLDWLASQKHDKHNAL